MSSATVRQSEPLAGKPGLKAGRDQRHRRREQREEGECGGQDVEVAGHAFREVLLRFYGAAGQAERSAVFISSTPAGGKFELDGGDGAVEVDGAAGVAENDGGETEAAGIESGVADAVVVGEAGEEDAVEAAFAEIAGEAGGGGAVVFEEGGVGVDCCGGSLCAG